MARPAMTAAVERIVSGLGGLDEVGCLYYGPLVKLHRKVRSIG
jgi:hypothetical protein